MHCSYCERRCDIQDGKTGFCRMYTSVNGEIRERFPDRWSACTTSQIESMPFYHVYPGSRCLIIGTSGCNFRCRYCSNAHLAKEDPGTLQERMFNFTAAELVAMAKKLHCTSIVFNVNEPAVSIPSLVDLSREAHQAGILTGCLTNGYMTEESAEIMASVFSFFNISLKGLSETFNKKYIGIGSPAPVLRNIRKLARDRHVEITTPVIPGGNDNEIDTIAGFLSDISPSIPWHVFRLLPEDEMINEEYPGIDTIDRELDVARKMLKYIYFHNFVGSDWVNTVCPSCGTVLIERFSLGCGGDKLNKVHCRDNFCPSCGYMFSLFNGKIHAEKTGEANR
jgi:AmmeMemoRadiSam system radical SAM enzyme